MSKSLVAVSGILLGAFIAIHSNFQIGIAIILVSFIILVFSIMKMEIKEHHKPMTAKDLKENPIVMILKANYKETEYGKKGHSKAEVLKHEEAWIIELFEKFCAQQNLKREEHLKTRVFYSFTEPDHIVCETTALTNEGVSVLDKVDEEVKKSK